MGTHKGVNIKIGWDDSEQKEFSRALKQPLMVQTPLQVILETLFSRIQSQAQLFNELNRRLERMEARDINGEELLGRIRMCEEQLKTINHERLSPFNQQEILQRLEDLEQAASTLPAPLPQQGSMRREESARRPPSSRSLAGAPGLEDRIQTLEEKLAGVYNLNGKLIALEHMAVELGVEIPDSDYTPEVTAEGYTPGPTSLPALPLEDVGRSASQNAGALQTDRSVSFHPNTAPAPVNARGASPRGMVILDRLNANGTPSLPNSRLGSPAQGAQRNSNSSGGPPAPGLAGVWPRIAGEEGLPATGSLRRSMSARRGITELNQTLEAVQQDNEELKITVASLKNEIASLGTTVADNQQSTNQRLEVLETSAVEMRENLTAEMAAVKKLATRDPEVSFADFSALGSRVDAALVDLAAGQETIKSLQEKELKPLSEAVNDLRDQVKKDNEPRDMDTLFHQRISKLEAQVGDIKNEVQMAVTDILDDVVKVSDLTALEETVEAKANAADVRQLAQQQAALAQSINGMADWLAVRPETADGARGTGASATKFRCLTCDREIKPQNLPSSAADKARGSFLPKLEHLPITHGTVPVGPGINAAEVRRLVEEKMAGTPATGHRGSPPRSQEVEEYATGTLGATGGAGDEGSRRGSPGRVRSGRVPVPMPNSGAALAKMSGQPRTPVFL